MKVYIAGPVTAITNYKETFFAAAEKLTKAGHAVMNPAVMPEAGFMHAEYMIVALAMQSICDATILLPGWEQSCGAKIEKKTAEDNGQPIFYGIDDFLQKQEVDDA